MGWEVEYTAEFDDWFQGLTEDEQERIATAVEYVQRVGPAARRPIVGEVQGSTRHNLKELIPAGAQLRVLFLFDPRSTAILLIGGDKTGQWKQWYREMIPVAEALYEEYLDELRKEGLIE